jgi:radical SAM-linked protein
LESAPWDVELYTCGPRPKDAVLPWQKAFSLGPDTAYFLDEWRLHTGNALTAPCGDSCSKPCGVCDESVFPVTAPPADNAAPVRGEDAAETIVPSAAGDAIARYGSPGLIDRHICAYEKTGKAAFLPHLSLMQVMERSLLRAGISSRFTGGFNPKPILEFAQPSSVGVESLDEIFSFETYFETPDKEKFSPAAGAEDIPAALNRSLPEGLRLKTVSSVRYREKGKKPPSLMSLYAGGRYELTAEDNSLISQTLQGFAENSSFRIVEQNPGRLVIDYISGANTKGFWFILKAALRDGVSALNIRKLSTYARHKETLGSYAEITFLLNDEI